MTSGSKKVLVATGGICTVAASGYAVYKAKKWDFGSVVNMIGGAAVFVVAVFG